MFGITKSHAALFRLPGAGNSPSSIPCALESLAGLVERYLIAMFHQQIAFVMKQLSLLLIFVFPQ